MVLTVQLSPDSLVEEQLKTCARPASLGVGLSEACPLGHFPNELVLLSSSVLSIQSKSFNCDWRLFVLSDL